MDRSVSVDDDLDTALRVLRAYMRAVALAEPLQRELARRHRIAVADLFALRRLRELGESPTTRFGDRCGLSPSATTDLVDRLEGAGLVSRHPHPTDRRVTLVRVTAAGDQALGDTALFRESSVMDRIRRLSRSDRERLAALLEQVTSPSAEPAVELAEVGG